MRRLVTLHRSLGVVACLGILIWSLSGILHPLMTRTQPQPVARMAPSVTLPEGVDLQALLRAACISRLTAVHPLTLAGETYVRVALPGGHDSLYMDVATGTQLLDGERRHAEFLARHFTGEQTAAVRAIRQVTAFDDDYPYVNRLLPVWRVDFDRADGLRAFVDPAHSRLATLSDDRQALLAATFRLLHNWGWADSFGPLRPVLMSLLLAATAATALFGLVMAVGLRRAGARLRRQPVRRWHRRVGLLVAFSALAATGSGAYHLLHDEAAPPPVADGTAPVFTRDQFGTLPALAPGESLALVSVDGRALWRVAEAARKMAAPGMPAEHTHHHAESPEAMRPALSGVRYLDAITHQPVPEAAARHAVALATYYRGGAAPVRQLETVTMFGGDYGFLNKRLPVVKVLFATTDQEAVYVEPATGEFAARVVAADRREGWSFSNLHKWQFFGANKTLRDILQVLFTLGTAAVAVVGLTLFLRRRV